MAWVLRAIRDPFRPAGVCRLVADERRFSCMARASSGLATAHGLRCFCFLRAMILSLSLFLWCYECDQRLLMLRGLVAEVDLVNRVVLGVGDREHAGVVETDALGITTEDVLPDLLYRFSG